jgi:hypothetical protein
MRTTAVSLPMTSSVLGEDGIEGTRTDAAPGSGGPGEPRPGADSVANRRITRAGRVGRTLQTHERLHRLRRELGKIDPAPANPEEARDAIVKAMARAELGGWAVPELSASTTAPCGSVLIRLLAHVIVINPSGAFRIVDTHAPRTPYFEMPGQDGCAFVPAADEREDA